MNRSTRSALLVLALALSLLAIAGCEEEPAATIQTADPMVRISPSVGGRGMAIDMELRGVNTQWQDGDIDLDLGDDILIDAVTVVGPNFAEATIQIDEAAVLGFRDILIEFPVGEGDDATLATFLLEGDEGFLVEPGGIAITPDRARLGETLQVEVTGFNTVFQDGSTWADFGEYIFINWVSVTDSTHATVSVSVDQRASPGLHDVALFNGPTGYTLMDGFFVDRSSIAIEIDPDHGNQGERLPFTVRGFNTHFDSAGDMATLIDLSTSICVEEDYPDCMDTVEPGGEVQVLSPTIVQGELEISNGAAPDLYDVRAYTIERIDFDENGLLETGEYEIVEEVILHEGFEVREVPIDCNDNPGVSFSFSVSRDIDNDSCTVFESVGASAVFFTPLDPPCGSPPGPPVFPYDIDYVQTLPSVTTDCPATPTCDAGPYVYLESDENVVTLARNENVYTGEIFYLPQQALTLDDYKFGYVGYDLRAEGSEDPTQIPAFVAADVLFTLPSDFELLEPMVCQNYTHDPANDLQVSWTPAQTYDVAGLSVLYQTSDDEDPPNTWQVITLPWDDGDHLWPAGNFGAPFPEGGGFFIFGAGVGEPKWFLDFGEGPVGVENQGRSGLSYRGFMLLQSPGEEEEAE
jgi:hypothetical protein